MTVDYTRPPQMREPAPPRSWWSRNWKWVVPLGCLTPVLLIGGCVAGIVFFVFSSIKATDLYEDAVQRAQTDPRVVEALGGPVKVGWWLTGSVNIEGNQGTADFTVPLQGTQKRGSLDVQGNKRAGEWTYSLLRVRVDGGPTIDLIPPEDPSLEGSADTDPADV